MMLQQPANEPRASKSVQVVGGRWGRWNGKGQRGTGRGGAQIKVRKLVLLWKHCQHFPGLDLSSWVLSDLCQLNHWCMSRYTHSDIQGLSWPRDSFTKRKLVGLRASQDPVSSSGITAFKGGSFDKLGLLVYVFSGPITKHLLVYPALCLNYPEHFCSPLTSSRYSIPLRAFSQITGGRSISGV